MLRKKQGKDVKIQSDLINPQENSLGSASYGGSYTVFVCANTFTIAIEPS
jgi:hypothetical protein